MQLNQETIIELQEVCFSYNKEEVIKDVTLSIHKGDYVGLVGPNGGGKSTLIKLMLGLLKPSKGAVKLLTDNIGYVPQRKYTELNFPVTVEEVVSMGRYGKRGLLRFPTKKDKEKVNWALTQVNMAEFKDRQISDLSGGQQQRVFIARAIASEPDVIFLDEPTVGVDIKTQKQFYELLRKLNKELHLTLILVTHELDVVAHEASELGYINKEMVYFGEPEEFLKGKYFHELIGKGGIHNVT
jgi:zinc transport system ATP-binding protein